MNVKSVEKLEKSQVAVTVEVTAEEFEAAVQKAYLKMRNKISVPGFRPGKAPRKMIEKLYGEGVFYSDAVDAALPDAYTQAIGSSGLDVVGYPEVEIVDDQIGKDGFTFKATVAVYPEVELGQYKGVSAVKEEVKVTADDVKERLNQMAEREARLVSVDRKVKKGDTAVIDFEGFKDDVAFEGGKAEDFTLSLGSGQFIPGFEDQIVGHNAGEDFDINVTFPDEYQVKELAGAPAVFKIKLKSISKKVMPELDDDMVKDSTEFDTVDEYKADVKKKLEEANEKHADSEVEAKIFDKVIENMTAEIPQVMFDNRVNEMIGELEQRLAPQGISLDLYMQYTGQTIDTVKKAYAEQAEKQVKLRLALEKIAKLENIEVTEDELKAEFDKLAEAYKLDVDQIKQFIHDDDLKKDIAVGKAVDLIKDAAVIK